MRIERGQHAVDGGAHQFLLVGCVDIFAADSVEDLAEKAQILEDLFVRARRALGLRGRLVIGRRIGDRLLAAGCRRGLIRGLVARRCFDGGLAAGGARGRVVLREDKRHGRRQQKERGKHDARGSQTHKGLSTLGSVCGGSPPSGRIDGGVVVSHLNIKGRV